MPTDLEEFTPDELLTQPGKPVEAGDPQLAKNLKKSASEATCDMQGKDKKEKHKALCTEIASLKDQLLRAAAELKNTQIRAEREVNHAHQFGLERFIKALIPVIDNLERALESSDTKVKTPLLEGIQLTHQLFLKNLEKFGVEQINPLHQVFDPKRDEAISIQHDSKAKPNTVLKVFEKAYRLHGRLIRAAKVIVSG